MQQMLHRDLFRVYIAANRPVVSITYVHIYWKLVKIDLFNIFFIQIYKWV